MRFVSTLFVFSFLFIQKNYCQTFSNNTPVPIPSSGIALSDITVSGVGVLGSGGCQIIESVNINVTHTWDGDLSIFLIAPSGQVLELSTANGASGNNYTSTTFKDNTSLFITAGLPPYTGDFKPEGRSNTLFPPNPPGVLGTYTFANTFSGINADGVWKLHVNDYIGIDFGVIDSWSITFGGGSNLSVNAGPDQNICTGQSATLTASNGNSYLWSNGNTSQSISVSPTATTTYSVTVSNGSGCTGVDDVKVNVNAPLNISLIQDVTVCNGNQATLSNPVGYNYLWQTGQTNPSINVNPSSNASYFVTVSSVGFCPAVKTFNVTVTPSPQINLGADVTVCGQNPTAFTANGGGTYLWNAGQNTAQINVNPSVTTTYTVTVTTNGCTATDDIKVIVNPIPNANAGQDKSICIGKSTTLIASGGTNYTWSNGTNTASNPISPTNNTTYSVTVSNAFGCSAVDDVSVNVNPSPIATVSPDVTICANAPLSLTSSGGQNYVWSNGILTANNNVAPSISTTYTVTVSDVNSCTATAQTNVVINPINADAGADVSICEGQSTTLIALGLPNATFSWSNGVNNASNPVSPMTTTTYTLTVSDALGCTKTDEVKVTVTSPPIASVSPDVTVCNGSPALLSANGGTNYAWSNGQSAASFNVFPSSNSTYTVSISNGVCTVVKQINVTVNQVQNVIITAPLKLCSGQANLTASSGFSTYNWSNGQSTSNINISQSGTYTVTASDASNCKSTASVTVANADGITIGGASSICLNGTASIFVNQNYNTYTWNTGQTGQNVSISQAGTYSVTATDAQGCTVSETINIPQASTPSVNILGTLGICPNGSTPLTASSSNVTYVWSNGSTANTINANAVGNYSVTATNPSGCKAENNVNVVAYNNPTVKIQGNNVICASGGTVSLGVNGTFSQYLWSNNNTTASLIATQSGNYGVTVSDGNGCKANDQFFISAQNVVAQITGSTSFCPGSSTLLNAIAPNASTYLWSNGTTTANAQISSTGTISVTVTDDKGCKGTTNVDVTLSSSLNPSIVGNKQICEGNETIFDVGAGFKNYLWSNGSTNSSIKISKSGNYSVTVNDGACSGSASIFLDVVKNNIKIDILGDSLICPNTTTNLSVATTFASYLWNNNNGTNSISNVVAGKYTISVSDQFGCIAEKNILVKTAAIPTPKIEGSPVFCPGGFTILNTKKYNTYAWSTAAQDSFITVNKAGQYELTVTDSEGCIGSTFINVTQSNGLVPTINGSKILCKGENLTLKTDNYQTYLWSNGNQSNSILIDKAGIYKVSVSDVSGCIGENEITIVERELEKPTIVGDTLFCEGKKTDLTVSNSTQFSSFDWSNGEKIKSINIFKSGIYTVSVSDGLCKSSNQISINVVKNILKAYIIGDTILCQNETTILSNSDKNIVNYTWNNGSQNITNQDSITSKGSTTWSLTVTDNVGCSATSSIKITEIPLPQTNIKGDTLIINATPTLLDAGIGFTSYLWNTGDNTQTISVTQSGIYSVTVSNLNDCKNVATIFIKSINFIKPEINGNNKICKNQKTILQVANSFDSYLWSNGEITPSIEVDKGGFYFVSVTKGSLIGVDTFEVIASTLNAELKTISNFNGFGVSCDGKNDGILAVQNISGAIPPLTYIWSNNANTPIINSLKPGVYEVSISDGLSCNWTQKTSIFSPKKISFQTSSIQANCKAANSAEIILTTIDNAIFPITVNVSQEDFIVQKTPFSIKNISEGTYEVKLSDANNCTETQIVNIDKPVIPTVSLGDDLEIYAGDEIQLFAQSNISPTQFIWSKISDLSCSNCPNPTVKPSQSGEYEVSVLDKFNCKASDIIKINVNKDVYIPTSFSPNGDQNNDFFSIFGNKSIKEINELRIYDRWGDIVFQGDTNNQNWDGNFNSTSAASGTYIYFVKIIFKDNSEKIIRGEVLLMR